MRKFPSGLSAAIAALVGILLPACHHGRFIYRYHRIPVPRFQKTDTQKLRLQLAEEDLVQLENRFGKIRVIEARGDRAILEANLDVSAASEEEADNLLDETRIVAERDGRGLTISARKPKQNHDRPFLVVVSYVLELPKGTRLDIESINGDISVDGRFGTTDLESRYGKIEVLDTVGRLAAKSSNGDISLGRIRGKEIEANTHYGKIKAENIKGHRLTLTTQNGDIAIEGADTDRIAVRSSYGKISLDAVRGDILVKSKTGNVRIESANEGSHEIKTSYGDITVRGTSGTLELTSTNGRISVEDFRGVVDADSQYGTIELAGAFQQVRAHSNNGNIKVHAERGSTSEWDWKLSSHYGELDLRLPPDFACALSMKTRYGKLTSGLPMNGVRLTGEKEINGSIGEGGGKVRLETTNGGIKLNESRN